LPTDALSASVPFTENWKNRWTPGGYTVFRSGHKKAIMTLVERYSGFAILMKVSHKTSKQFADPVIKKLRSSNPMVKTITFFKGKEFSEHAYIDKAL
jgi:IS30 family transposase